MCTYRFVGVYIYTYVCCIYKKGRDVNQTQLSLSKIYFDSKFDFVWGIRALDNSNIYN